MTGSGSAKGALFASTCRGVDVKPFIEGRGATRSRTSSDTLFVEDCGLYAGYIARADASGLGSEPLSVCSAEIPNDGISDTEFLYGVLSPDGTRIAVESRHNNAGSYTHSVIVYDLEGNQIIRHWGFTPAWTPDGQLVYGTTVEI